MTSQTLQFWNRRNHRNHRNRPELTGTTGSVRTHSSKLGSPLIPATVVVGFYGVPLRTRFGRVLQILTFIFVYIYLYLCLRQAPPSDVSMLISSTVSFMRLNSQSVSGRFDEDEFHCLVSPAVALGADGSSLERAVVQALYEGTYFTAEVPVTVRDINCDVIIGHEWIALFHLVVSQPDGAETLSRGTPSPLHLEESLHNLFPIDGSGDGSVTALCGREETQHAELGMEEIRSHTVRTLEDALRMDGTQSCERQFFTMVPKDQ